MKRTSRLVGACLGLALALLCASPALADDFAMPNTVLTPGAVDAPKEVFCSRPAKERPKASKICAKVFDEYGISRNPFKRAAYQCDHLIPLSIGGATTAANLWPQPGVEDAFKDLCDTRIHLLVCVVKSVPAAEAQAAFATDWVEACAKYIGR